MAQFKGNIQNLSKDLLTGKVSVSVEVENVEVGNSLLLVLETMKDCDITCEIQKYYPKRSLDANAYAWVLIDKLAKHLRLKKEEVYRNYITEVGGTSITGCYKNESVQGMKDGWVRGSLGRQVEEQESKIQGCTNLTFYIGSSEFDSEQMNRFIELIVQDCKDQGIQTLTPKEIAELRR